MKNPYLLFTKAIYFSLLLLFVSTIKIMAQTPAQLSLSGISNPLAANGTYVKTGTRGYVDGTGTLYDYWKHQTQNYYIYCDEYALYGYWIIDLDLNDNNVNELFFSKGYLNSSSNHDSPTIAASPDLVVWNNEVPGSGTGNPSFGVLPVELTAFKSSIGKNNIVNLNWQTATEVNNYGFEVERTSSRNINWGKIGFVQGHGNSNSTKEYTLMDKPLGGRNFKYRLKQIDFDGKYEYSPEVEVKLDVQAEFLVKQNFPNPFNPTTKIEYAIPSDNNVEIKIFNVLGMEVATLLNEHRQAGVHNIEFDASNLSSRIYFYNIVYGNKSEIKKMILLR